jgi:hypothetical protein
MLKIVMMLHILALTSHASRHTERRLDEEVT